MNSICAGDIFEHKHYAFVLVICQETAINDFNEKWYRCYVSQTQIYTRSSVSIHSESYLINNMIKLISRIE